MSTSVSELMTTAMSHSDSVLSRTRRAAFATNVPLAMFTSRITVREERPPLSAGLSIIAAPSTRSAAGLAASTVKASHPATQSKNDFADASRSEEAL
ncbi:hypothetical protein [Microbacterium maritypicum]